MNKAQKEMVNGIATRWHVQSSEGLTVQQAALDIGYLIGLLVALDKELFPDGKTIGSGRT